MGKRIITCCEAGEENDPPSLKWRLEKGMKEKEEKAEKIWQANDKKVTNFQATASNLSSNPGDHAR